MRKFFFFMAVAVCTGGISASAQVSFNASPDRNAKATMAMLTLHTELSEAAFIHSAQSFSDYYKDITAVHNDHGLTAETAQLKADQSAKALNEKLKAILTNEQMGIWTGTVQPDIEKQLRDN